MSDIWTYSYLLNHAREARLCPGQTVTGRWAQERPCHGHRWCTGQGAKGGLAAQRRTADSSGTAGA